jgi:TPR repeat protein
LYLPSTRDLASIPVYDFAVDANIELENMSTETYYSCCGKSMCGGCFYSFKISQNDEKCPFCKADEKGKTDEERVEEFIKRVEVNDAGAMCVLGSIYYHGQLGLQQDWGKALELYARATKFGSSEAHSASGNIF